MQIMKASLMYMEENILIYYFLKAKEQFLGHFADQTRNKMSGVIIVQLLTWQQGL